MGNTFGKIFRLSTFGESHGPAIGGVIDGVPAGVRLDVAMIQRYLDRRRPGAGRVAAASARRESDTVELLSGVYEGLTLGTPIGFIIRNKDARSSDYEPLRHHYRPSHADFTYDAKYGHRDWRGGGRASARETACRVVGGAVADAVLRQVGISVDAFTIAIGDVTAVAPFDRPHYAKAAKESPIWCGDSDCENRMFALLDKAARSGDTLGGIVGCMATGVPPGLGEPAADKLQSLLAAAMLSIPAAHGFDYGMGFDGALRLGSEMIDRWNPESAEPLPLSNHSGGIQGGISNGQPITMRVAFKPVATMMRPLEMACDNGGKPEMVTLGGRHDVCVVPRAVPVVAAMASMTLLDAWLMSRLSRLDTLLS